MFAGLSQLVLSEDADLITGIADAVGEVVAFRKPIAIAVRNTIYLSNEINLA
jgi:hypothetical protein